MKLTERWYLLVFLVMLHKEETNLTGIFSVSKIIEHQGGSNMRTKH